MGPMIICSSRAETKRCEPRYTLKNYVAQCAGGAAREKEYRDQGLYCLGSVDVCKEAHRPRYGGEHEEDNTTMDEILEIANSWGGGARRTDIGSMTM